MYRWQPSLGTEGNGVSPFGGSQRYEERFEEANVKSWGGSVPDQSPKSVAVSGRFHGAVTALEGSAVSDARARVPVCT